MVDIYFTVHILDITHLTSEIAEEKFFHLTPDITAISVTIIFGADYAQSKIIRDLVRSIFDRNAILPLYGWKFALVTDELLNNAIEHGSQPWDVNICVITATRDESKRRFYISLDVHDTGSGKKTTPEAMWKLRKNIYLNMAGIYLKRRGRWLFLMVEKLVDKLDFQMSPHGWLLVHVEKTIKLQDASAN